MIDLLSKYMVQAGRNSDYEYYDVYQDYQNAVVEVHIGRGNDHNRDLEERENRVNVSIQ